MNELKHYNVKGTNWYKHKFGNWERHAKYANGQPNPETNDIKVPQNVTKKDIAKRIDNQVKYGGQKGETAKLNKDYRKDFKDVYYNTENEYGEKGNWNMPAEEAGKIMKKELKKRLDSRFSGGDAQEKKRYAKEYNKLLDEYISDTKELDEAYKVMREVTRKNRKETKEKGFVRALIDYHKSEDKKRYKKASKYETDYLNKYMWAVDIFML